MDTEKSYIQKITNESYNTPDKMRRHIDILKTERNNLMSEVAHLHRILLFIVRNNVNENGGI